MVTGWVNGAVSVDDAPTSRANLGAVAKAASSTDNALARFDGTSGGALLNSTVIVTDNGEMTNASQPAFLAYLATSDSGVAGNGAPAYMLGSGNALTEVFDQNSDFVTTGTFTSPVTGIYHLGVKFALTGGTQTNDQSAFIVTSNRTYEIKEAWTARSNTTVQIGFDVLADMDAADTCTFECLLNGDGGANFAALGASDLRNACWGYLVC